jgi:hypothetical protein
LLYAAGMAPSLRNRDDFTLRIVVAEPEKWHPELVDEDGATRPFKKTLEAPPERPRPQPMSLDEYERLSKRASATRKMAWARRMLRKFGF